MPTISRILVPVKKPDAKILPAVEKAVQLALAFDAEIELFKGVVVMGAVSRSGLKRIFIGNTAESILDSLRCDVLVVKPPGVASAVVRSTQRKETSTRRNG